MMTSSNGNIFRVTGHLCGEFTGDRWIPRAKASDLELMFRLICARMNGWVNNREAGDLRRHRAHYGVTVMINDYGHHNSVFFSVLPMHRTRLDAETTVAASFKMAADRSVCRVKDYPSALSQWKEIFAKTSEWNVNEYGNHLSHEIQVQIILLTH